MFIVPAIISIHYPEGHVPHLQVVIAQTCYTIILATMLFIGMNIRSLQRMTQ
jgi:hypothetical protein